MIGDRYDRDIRGAHDAGLFTVWVNVRNEHVPEGAPPPDATCAHHLRGGTRAMTQSVRDLENTFARAFVLLVRNPTIVVPGIVLGAIGFGLGFAILAIAGASAIGGVSGNDAATTVPEELMSILAAVVAVILALVTLICEMAYVTGMAGAAWKSGEAHLRDGYRAFQGRGTQILIADHAAQRRRLHRRAARADHAAALGRRLCDLQHLHDGCGDHRQPNGV